MNIASMLSGSIAEAIDSAGNAFDKLFTSDDERNQAKIVMEKTKAQLQTRINQIALEYEKQVTDRWKSDNDHLITRVTRPAIVIWVYLLFTLVILADGNAGKFHINEAYIPLLETLMVTVTIAFFGSRGVEKVSRFKAQNTKSAP